MNSETPRTTALLMNLKATPEYTKEKDTDRDRALCLCRKLEIETQRLMAMLQKTAGYLATVRLDRKHTDDDGNEYALQTMDWSEGAIEYATEAQTMLDAYAPAESANDKASEPPAE